MSDSEETGNEATQFKIGNTAWRSRSTHGRNPKFKGPDELDDACNEYFQWVEDNPLIGVESVKFQGFGRTMPMPKMRAMTLDGLCTFLDISDETWRKYREKTDFIGVITRVERIIRTQKFEGAAADLLNANIIARDLGLSDKKDVEHSGSISNGYTDDLEANAIAATQAKSSESEE